MADQLKKEEDALDVQAVLRHLDEHYRSQMLAYRETGEDKQELLAKAGRALEAAKERFFVVNQQKGSGADQEDSELHSLILQARENFRNLEYKTRGSGPPLA